MKTILCFLLILVCSMTVFPHASLAQNSRPMVKLIYFLPSDREPDPDIDAKMDTLIKDVQQFYANQMATHGFGRKTFQFETDAHGNAVVYHINGKFDDVYYHDESGIVWEEIDEQFNRSKDIYLTALDVSTEEIGIGEGDTVYTVCGKGGGGNQGGEGLIPASGLCFTVSTTAHELGHAFGLHHDFRDGAYLMSYGPWQDRISQCTAEWLDVHRAFNPRQATANKHNEGATIEMLPPSFVAPPNTIRFRFKISDPEGLHQVQLLTPTLRGSAKGFPELVNYKELNGAPNKTVEFVTTDLVLANETVSLQVIDKSGSMSWSEEYSIDVASLLPRSEVVSIPDPNLAAAIRQEIGNSITTLTLLNLRHLKVYNSRIKDLTGLEHAHALIKLSLRKEINIDRSSSISDVSPLAGLTHLRELRLSSHQLSDVSPLAGLTQLQVLQLSSNQLSDVLPLAGLTRLRELWLNFGQISDVSPLAGLTQLQVLWLDGNVSDVSPLAGLTQLRDLVLDGNDISDVSPLAELTQLERLLLDGNDISDVSPLAGLIQLGRLGLDGNDISDVSPLAELTQLQVLRLNSNNISDVSPLAGLTQLKYLKLSNNDISDISPLENLTQLSVDIGGNPISDVSLAGLKFEFVLNMVPGLKRAIKDEIGEPITPHTMLKLTELNANGSLSIVADEFEDAAFTMVLKHAPNLRKLTFDNDDISDVSLLAELTQLRQLTLNYNRISDVSPLAKLTKLEHLELDNNEYIRDVSPLAKLTKLELLWLDGNDIWDVSPLAGLTQLRYLTINNNRISDVSPLAKLTQLEGLWLWGNQISDISPLAELTQLRRLMLNGNDISDVSPLAGLNLIGTEQDPIGLHIERNPLSYASIHTHIPAMQARGSVVKFDNTPHPALVKISGDAQKGTAGEALMMPFVVEAQDEHGKPMKGVSVTFAVTSGRGKLSATTVTTNAAGRVQTTLTLGSGHSENIVRATATEIPQAVITFTATAGGEPTHLAVDVNGDGIVNIQDLVLVASNLGKTGQNAADVNADGIVNIQDLVLVAGALGTSAAAPSIHPQSLEMLTAADVKSWLSQAQHFNLTDAMAQKGILFLEQLLAVLTPKETALLHNFPNPFNPETWIPYHLVEPANVTLTIYSIDGKVVRRLDLGHQDAGYYQSKARAAYWDGRNSVGERVCEWNLLLYFDCG